MQVTQTNAEGLKRELKVVIAQGELDERFLARLDEVKQQIQLKGFRKGKVPSAHIRKLYGRRVMADVLEQAVAEMSKAALSQRNERAAHQPSIGLSEDKEEIERVLAGKSDLTFTMSYEALPDIELVDLAGLRLEREVADVAPEAVDRALADLVERATRYEATPERAAVVGDQVSFDYVGRIDGQEFEGGKAEDVQLVIGQGGFIPGFSEGLVGVLGGEERIVDAKFPDPYPQDKLAGKDAQFSVKVKEVAMPIRAELGDEFAKTLGAESLAKLREMVAARIAAEYAGIARIKLKRQVLDALDKAHDFSLPETLVGGEYDGLWGRFNKELADAGKTLADADKSEDELKAEYRRLAERRVRLGLVLGEIGSKAKLEVNQDELRRAMIEQARRYPGQEKLVYEFYQKNPSALVELRAPLFEDKVLEHIVQHAKPVDRKVTLEELLKPVDDDQGLVGAQASYPSPDLAVHDHEHDHAHDHAHDHVHDHAQGGQHEHHGHEQGPDKT
jgi:trigger factor